MSRAIQVSIETHQRYVACRISVGYQVAAVGKGATPAAALADARRSFRMGRCDRAAERRAAR